MKSIFRFILLQCILLFHLTSSQFFSLHQHTQHFDPQFPEEEKISISTSKLISLDSKIRSAIKDTDNSLASISSHYDLQKFPKAFLGAIGMPEMSWKVFISRIYSRLLEAVSFDKPQTFNTVFLGSSVTAGHDNDFNVSTTEVLRSILAPVFQKANLGFSITVKNVAIGGTPCFPYDICLEAHAGSELDLVQWEQTYFCFNNDARRISEGLMRALIAKNKYPILVFADSSTGHWKRTDCPAQPPSPSLDSPYINTTMESIVSNVNKGVLSSPWGWVTGNQGLLSKYNKYLALQFYNHQAHLPYKCQGPYVPEFCEGAASWHPSVSGHRLRASRYAYTWLSAWKEALKLLQIEVENQKRLHSQPTPSSDPTVSITLPNRGRRGGEDLGEKSGALYFDWHRTKQCYTDMQPHSDLNLTLSSLRVVNGHEGKGWKLKVQEELLGGNQVEKWKKRGYLDYKYTYIGNKEAGPISFRISVTHKGSMLICQAPAIWGKPPPTCASIQTTPPHMFLSKLPPTTNPKETPADFIPPTKESAPAHIEVHGKWSAKADELCAPLTNDVDPGEYVFTVLPSTTDNIVIAYLIFP